MKIKILIAGGGTGGHLYPALALAEEIKRKYNHAEVIFAGTAKGLETKVVPAQGYVLKKIWIRGLMRSLSLENLLFPLRLIVSLTQAALLILQFRPDVVVGTGGYVSGPVLLAAALLRRPTLIQEQNSFPGIATRILATFVDQVHLSFEESVKYFKRKANLFVSGNPLRSQLGKISKQEALKKFDLNSGMKTLLIFGGSQGAHSINQAVLALLDKLMTEESLQLIWGSGHRDFRMIQQRCRQYGNRIFVKPFIEDMASAYAASDLALCRSGATTVAELTACGLPAILVPYPYAAAGHQEFNARTLADRGAAQVVLDRGLQTEKLEKMLVNLLGNDQKRKKMGEESLRLARPEAAKNIIESMLDAIS